MKKRVYKAQFGEVCSGSLRAEDLISAFSRELSLLLPSVKGSDKKRYQALVKEANAINDFDTPEASGVVEALGEALNELAPAYGSFGNLIGDGACFGFWLDDEFVHSDFDGLSVSDLSEVPKCHTGEVLVTNDHGNMTLFVFSRGRKKEIWSIV